MIVCLPLVNDRLVYKDVVIIPVETVRLTSVRVPESRLFRSESQLPPPGARYFRVTVYVPFGTSKLHVNLAYVSLKMTAISGEVMLFG